MEQKQESIEVLAVIPDGEARHKILGQALENGLLILPERTFEEGKAQLNRQGYRYRMVLVDTNIADGVTDWIAEVSGRFPWIAFALFATGVEVPRKKPESSAVTKTPQILMVDSSANVHVRFPGGVPVAEAVFELLNECRASLPSLPNPPYQTGRTRFLKEVGPLLFSVSLSDSPWALEGDAFTLPVNEAGGLGSLGEAWIEELGEIGGEALRDVIKKSLSVSEISPHNPVHGTFVSEAGSGPQTIRLILATSSTAPMATVMSAVEACIGAITLATSLADCRTLILPVIGGGSRGLPIGPIVRGVLEEFDPTIELGALQHVIFTVHEPENLEELTAVDRDAIARVQKLENDVPSGPDRLQVQSEVFALADAIALRELKPPLVVGVLGGWGTGKSFVLHLLKERLRQIRSWDVSNEEVRNRFPYVGHPYLVHFDAWTYAKSDLWASLMQRILLDLDRQLSLERTLNGAKSGLLAEGVDIWHLLDDLTTAQLDVLKEDLGAEAIEAFEHWKSGDNVAQALWQKLQQKRRNELTELDAARKSLTQTEHKFASNIADKQHELNGRTATLQRALDGKVAQERHAVRLEIARKKADLDIARRIAAEESDRVIEFQARHDAWGPAADELRTLMGKSVDTALDKIGAKDGNEPISIFGVIKEVSLFTRYTKGLLRSGSGIAFLVFAILSPAGAWLLSTMADLPVVSGFVGPAGLVGGALGSAYSALTKLNRSFEEKQADYEARVEKTRSDRNNERERVLQEKLKNSAHPIELAIENLETQSATNVETWETETNEAIKSHQDERRQEIGALMRDRDEALKGLNEDVLRHERRAGLTGRGQSLLDIVRNRASSGYYEDKLGVLHQIQQDLLELTEALVPVDGHDTTLFPRGTPRIILVVDDLDRCPPDRVVQMLEAAQLLVKTRLFVVVLAMDVRYITRALEKEYKEILVRDGEPSGLDYIEKIVQVPYRVPGIAPGVMRSFLQGQMTVVESGTRRPSGKLPGGTEPEEEVQTATPSETPVFVSSFDPDAGVPTEPLPTRVQHFDEMELTLLTECCNAARVSPRAGRRLVNVFKLLKIIWFHRGLHREPDHDVKQVMLLLLALSSAQPVVMRQVLQYLEDEYREGDLGQVLKQVLLTSLMRPSLSDIRPGIRDLMTDLIETHGRFPPNLTLKMVELDNIRLVKSFSFVGEVDSEQRTRKQTETEPTTELDPKSEKSGAQKKSGTAGRSGKENG